jgi:diadenosine tetraphosphate (Ap4A) HIT family hydrolase
MKNTKTIENCIFCKIVNHEIPSFKIYEDDNFLAILDIQPNCLGQTIVISKSHYPSNIVNLAEDIFTQHFLVAKKVANMLNQRLKTERTAIVLEGLGINHAHIKLYPLNGLNEEWKSNESKDRVYFDKYPGFVSTKLGPLLQNKKLKEIQKRILK